MDRPAEVRITRHGVQHFIAEVFRMRSRKTDPQFRVDRCHGCLLYTSNYFFQDELLYPLTILSWAEDMPAQFRDRKGYDILPYLAALKYDIGDITAKIRLDYCDVVMTLAEERYFKPIFDWNDSRGLISVSYTHLCTSCSTSEQSYRFFSA